MPTLTESMREILNKMNESEAQVFEIKEVDEETEVEESEDDLNEEKADKDYDGDGEVESKEEEYMGSKDKAIKKAEANESVDPKDWWRSQLDALYNNYETLAESDDDDDEDDDQDKKDKEEDC